MNVTMEVANEIQSELLERGEVYVRQDFIEKGYDSEQVEETIEDALNELSLIFSE